MSDWRGKHVTITGGSGFVGSNLAQRLLKEGARVRAVDNLERGRLNFLAPVQDDIEFMELDLRDRDASLKATKDTDVVFHLASKVGGIKVYLEQAATVLINNLLIDQQVFAAVIENGVPSLFYAGSGHVYPEDRQQTPDAPPFKESDAYPASPALSYGWAKMVGELAVEAMVKEHPHLRATIARLVGAYGNNQDFALETGSVIPVFCHRAVIWPEGQPFRIWGTGEETRSYCFIDDVIDAMMLSMDAQEKHKLVGPYNLAAEGRVTIREIAETIVKISGKEIDLSFDTSVETAIWGQAFDTSLARQLLGGWKPKISLEEGLRRTMEWVAAARAEGLASH